MKKVMMVAAPVHPVPPRKGAAVEWWIYQVCRRLSGFEPHVVCIGSDEYPDEEQRDGIHYHRIRMGRIYKRLFQKITRLDPWSYARRVARHIDVIRPEIVHVHNAPELFVQIRRHCQWHGAFWILHMQNEMPSEVLGGDTLLLADSQYLKNFYAAQQPHAQLDVITNGVDTELYVPTWMRPNEIYRLKTELGIPSDRKVVLYAGRVSPEKGPLDLVHAFHKLLALRDDVSLLLVGEIPRRNNPNDKRMRYGRLVTEACETMAGRCRCIGVVRPDRIQDYYGIGDLVVVPSRFEEPFGMVAIEAMAAGVPVLAARKGGLPEFVKPDETGFLISNTEDPVSFAYEMHLLLNSPVRLDRVRYSARRYVEQCHRWEIVARDLEAKYQTLLG